jgi:hypothetical protein
MTGIAQEHFTREGAIQVEEMNRLGVRHCLVKLISYLQRSIDAGGSHSMLLQPRIKLHGPRGNIINDQLYAWRGLFISILQPILRHGIMCWR